ncbi:LamG domain-containing protein [bacterium]|nr:LamG domain-containing protein [bacterium]
MTSKCYKTVSCDAKPANSEWNGDSSYSVEYDVDAEAWNPGPAYATNFGDGDPEPCQFKCKADYTYTGAECKKKSQCSAVFDGSSSKIAVQHNDLLNLDSETWTIEAWIKQGDDDVANYAIHPILRKGGTSSDAAYYISGFYTLNNGAGYGLSSYQQYTYSQGYGPQAQTKTAELKKNMSNVPYSAEWTHIAMVQHKEQQNWWSTYKLLVFVNGEQISSQDYESNYAVPTTKTVAEALYIGVNLSTGKHFKGLIDSIKISSVDKYSENFTPGKFLPDDDTIAFWDFNGSTEESKNNMTITSAENITYSDDCL